MLRHPHTTETKKKMSIAHTGKVGYWKGKTGNRKGKKLSPDQLKKYRSIVDERSNRIWKTSENVQRYQLLHLWIRRKFGLATGCENTKCPRTSKTYDWALLHGKEYERDRTNFWQLCRSCHTKYDKNKL